MQIASAAAKSVSVIHTWHRLPWRLTQAEAECVQVFDGDIAYLHQAAIIAKSHDATLGTWAKEYYLASAADRCCFQLVLNV